MNENTAAKALFTKEAMARGDPGALVGASTVDVPLSFIIVEAVGSLLEALAGVYFLRHLVHFTGSLACLQDVGTLLLYGAMLSSMINATISVTGLVLNGLAVWSM